MAQQTTPNVFVPPSKSGTYFVPDRNRLYAFDRAAILVVTLWPLPRAWRKQKSGWMHSWANIRIPQFDLDAICSMVEDDSRQLLLPFMKPSGCQAWLHLYNTIPRHVRSLVSVFPKRSHWNVLNLVARCGKPAEELLESNPALGWCLANSHVFRTPVQRPYRQARALLKRKRLAILKWLGFVPTESVQRVLAKVPPADCGSRLLYVRDAMTDAGMMKKLRHLQSLPAPVLRIATDRHLQHLASARLLGDIAACPGREARRFPRMLADVRALLRCLTYEGTRSPIESIPELLAQHQELVSIMDQMWGSGDTALDRPPPPAPIQGSRFIRPIRTYEAMATESRLQRNCVGDQKAAVVRGRAFFYKVVLPWERATLSLVRTSSGSWKLGQLRARENKPVSKRTHRFVQAWLETRGIPPRRPNR